MISLVEYKDEIFYFMVFFFTIACLYGCLNENDLTFRCQSEFCSLYSTLTALLEIRISVNKIQKTLILTGKQGVVTFTVQEHRRDKFSCRVRSNDIFVLILKRKSARDDVDVGCACDKISWTKWCQRHSSCNLMGHIHPVLGSIVVVLPAIAEALIN